MDYLKVLSTLSRDEQGRFNISEFYTQWRRRFSIQLQRCNASVILPGSYSRLQEDVSLMWTLMSFNSVYVKFTSVFSPCYRVACSRVYVTDIT